MTAFRTIGIYLLFFSFPLIAVLKGKGIIISLLLAFFLFNGFSSFIKFFTEKEWKGIGTSAVGIFITLLILYCFCARLFASPFPSLLHLGRLILLLGISFFTIRGAQHLLLSEKRKIMHLFFISYIFYGVFFLLELYGGHWVSKFYLGSLGYGHNQFIRGIVILTFLFLPFSWCLKSFYSKERFVLFVTISLLILVLLLVQAQPSAARLAIAIAGVFFIMNYFYKNWGFVILTSVCTYLIVAPFLFLHVLNRHTLFDLMHHLPSSYQHRIEIWNETSKHIVHKPLMGYGFDYAAQFKEAPPRCAHHPLKIFKLIHLDNTVVSKIPHPWGGVVCYKDTLVSTHPHNGALQIWLEFGLIGILITCFILYRFTQYASALSPLYRGYLYSLFGLCLVYWNVSFGLWQNWMIALVTLTFSLFQLIKSLPSKKKEDAYV